MLYITLFLDTRGNRRRDLAATLQRILRPCQKLCIDVFGRTKGLVWKIWCSLLPWGLYQSSEWLLSSAIKESALFYWNWILWPIFLVWRQALKISSLIDCCCHVVGHLSCSYDCRWMYPRGHWTSCQGKGSTIFLQYIFLSLHLYPCP